MCSLSIADNAEFGRKLLCRSAFLHGSVYQPSGKSLRILLRKSFSLHFAHHLWLLFVEQCRTQSVINACTGAQRQEQQADCTSSFSQFYQVVAGAMRLRAPCGCSEVFAGVERLGQQPGTSARSNLRSTAPAQPRLIRQQNPFPAASSGGFVNAHVPQPACERLEAAARKPCVHGEVSLSLVQLLRPVNASLCPAVCASSPCTAITLPPCPKRLYCMLLKQVCCCGVCVGRSSQSG